MVMNKFPPEIKGLLYQATKQAESWEGFIQMAEEVSWLSYPDKSLLRVEEYKDLQSRRVGKIEKHGPRKANFNNNKDWPKDTRSNGNRMGCILHGECNHSTRECRIFSEIIQRERNRLKDKKISLIEENSDEETKDIFNKNFIYSCKDKFLSKNLFTIKVGTNGKTEMGLIDTDADVSIIGANHINIREEKLDKYNGIVKTADGKEMNIIGRIKDMEIVVNESNRLKISPLIINRCSSIILGTDFILNNLQCLDLILKRLKVDNIKIKAITISEEQR